jgi:hypothetical protein
MTIDIAYYVSKIQYLMGIIINRAKEAGYRNVLVPADQKDILLAGALTVARKLEEEIHNDVKEKEGRSYGVPSNEMQLLAFAVILSAWSGWVFKAKSEDPTRDDLSREGAKAISKCIEAIIVSAIRGGQNIGKGNETPEGKEELIDIR